MKLPLAVPAVAVCGLAILWVPLVVLVVLSFNADRFGRGFDPSLVWYAKLFANAEIGAAAMNSLILAVSSTTIATVLGTMLALGVHRSPWSQRMRGTMELTVYLPVVTPDIILAAGMVAAFSVMQGLGSLITSGPGLGLGMWLMILGHVTFQISFVALVVAARLALIDRDQDEAARDLYAGSWYTFTRVILPQLAPAIAAGGMLAFVLSLDDFVVSLFTYSTTSTTLPLLIYAVVKRNVTPEIHALSTVIIAITTLLVLAMAKAAPQSKDP